MGNVFSGQTEDLLLYYVLPLATLGLVAAVTLLESLLGRTLAARAETWRDPLAPTQEPTSVDYRAPAVERATARAPSSVRRLARASVAWAAGTATVFGVATVCAFALAGLSIAPALVPITATVASTRVVRAAFALADRHDASAPGAIDRARGALLVHHALLFVVGTGLFGVVLLGELQYLLSQGASRHGLVGIGAVYAVTTLVPCLFGVGLARWFRTVRPLYQTASAS